MNRDELIDSAEVCLRSLRELTDQALATETAHHLRNSGCELLKAVRSSLDAVITALESEEQAAAPPAAGEAGKQDNA
jgi:hypothetical protein